MQLRKLSKDLADIVRHYNQSPTIHLLLRQYQTTENGGEVLYVVGEDEQGKERIVVKVALITSASEADLMIDLCRVR